MFRKFTFLAIASVLIFSSCTKDEVVDIDNSNSNTTTDIFAPKQDILFHYSFENQATGELKGWVIDKEGTIRTYDFTNATDVPEFPSTKDVQDEIMQNVYDYTTPTDIKIDIEVLKPKYKKISTVATGRIDAQQVGTAGEGTTSIKAYHYVAICDDYNPTHHQMIVLESFGEINEVNAMPAAAPLVEWLKEIQANENL